MEYLVRMNGMKVRLFTFKDTDDEEQLRKNYKKVEDWANSFCKGKIKISLLTETKLPLAMKLRPNDLMRNYGAYRYNPYTSLG